MPWIVRLVVKNYFMLLFNINITSNIKPFFCTAISAKNVCWRLRQFGTSGYWIHETLWHQCRTVRTLAPVWWCRNVLGPKFLDTIRVRVILNKSRISPWGLFLDDSDYSHSGVPIALEGRNSPYFAFFSPNSIALQAEYVTVVEDTPVVAVKYCLAVPVFHFWPKLMHPAVQSLCDSWASCTCSCMVISPNPEYSNYCVLFMTSVIPLSETINKFVLYPSCLQFRLPGVERIR